MRVSASNLLRLLGVMGSHCREVWVLLNSDECQQMNSETLWRNEGFPDGPVVKNPPAMQETQGQPLGWADPLEEGMATHSVFLPGESYGQRSLAVHSP